MDDQLPTQQQHQQQQPQWGAPAPPPLPPGYSPGLPPQPPYGPPPQGYYQRIGTNGLAIAGMVLGIIGLVAYLGLSVVIPLLAVIFGHRSLHVIRKDRQGGKGFAVTAITLGWIGLAIGLVFWTFAGIGFATNHSCTDQYGYTGTANIYHGCD